MSFVDPTGHYTYSFSGADAKPWVYFEERPQDIRLLNALSTISFSVHESKGQARVLGRRGITGLARGVRTIAGSMIFTVIEDNPLRPIIDNYQLLLSTHTVRSGWSLDRDKVGVGNALQPQGGVYFQFNNVLAALIPPFSLMVRYVSEGARFAAYKQEDYMLMLDEDGNDITDRVAGSADIPQAALLLRGIEFIDEGMVTSVSDIVSEVTLSFIATEYLPLATGSAEYHFKHITFSDPLEAREAEVQEILAPDRPTNTYPIPPSPWDPVLTEQRPQTREEYLYAEASTPKTKKHQDPDTPDESR